MAVHGDTERIKGEMRDPCANVWGKDSGRDGAVSDA